MAEMTSRGCRSQVTQYNVPTVSPSAGCCARHVTAVCFGQCNKTWSMGQLDTKRPRSSHCDTRHRPFNHSQQSIDKIKLRGWLRVWKHDMFLISLFLLSVISRPYLAFLSIGQVLPGGYYSKKFPLPKGSWDKKRRVKN